MKSLVIGGGIFGVTTAIELSKSGSRVDLFESTSKLMGRATTVNQNRFHLGFHYPRSLATAKQCQAGIESFKEYFGSALLDTKENYYAISNKGSRVSFKQYLNFCEELCLSFEEKFPNENFLRRSKVSGCINVPEQVINLSKMRQIARGLLKKNRVNVFLNREFVEGEDKKYDIVVNATYSQFNVINKMLRLPTKRFRYDICNVPVIKLPKKMKNIGITIMDGKFYSIIPYANSPYHLFWSVAGSTIRSVSKFPPKGTNTKIARYKDSTYIPILKHAELVDVLRVTKILRPDVELSDERLTDFLDYKNGKFAILSAKINTCVLTARSISSAVKNKSLRKNYSLSRT